MVKNPDAVAASLAGIAAMYQREEANGARLDTPYAYEAADAAPTHFNKLGLVGGPDEVTEDEVTEVVAAFATAERHLFKVESERMLGITEDDSDYQHRLLGRWRSNLPVRKDAGIPLEEFFRLYWEDWAKSYPPARVKRKVAELKRAQAVFAECLGSVPKVKEVTPETALSWREYYQYEFNDEPLSNKTVNTATTTMSAVFNFGVKSKKRFAEINPFRGLQLPEGVKSEKSRIFESDELRAYVEMLGDLHNPDRLELTWIPLVMAFSGMRCNEIAQLFVDDIQYRDGIDYIRVAENCERNQHVKTDESRREVPVHPVLVDFGFLRYVVEMRESVHASYSPIASTGSPSACTTTLI